MKEMDGWRFLRLVHALRQAALPISPEDVRDALRCLATYPGIPPRDVLRSVFVRRPQDAPIFEMVWDVLEDGGLDLEMFNRHQNGDGKGQEKGAVGFGGLGLGRGWGGISLTAKGDPADEIKTLKPVSLALLADIARNGGDVEDLKRQVLAQINYYGWINAFDLGYRRGKLSEEEWFAHLEQRAAVEETVRKLVVTALVHGQNSWRPVQRQHWLYKPLSALNDDEKRQVKESIRQWARTLAIRPGIRWKRANKGRIDVTRLIQRSAEGGGVIFRLNCRKLKPRMAELVVLCDISNSVAAHVEFLLYLTGCLKDRFRKVKVYFFIDTLWDVDRFEHQDLSDMMQEIKSWGYRASSGFSDYGKVFREFVEDYLPAVSSRTVMIILGDGKNNYRPAQEEYLAEIAAKVKKIYWLNPLDYEQWRDRDNVLKDYYRYCTKVFRCRSASDLKRIVQGVNL